MEHLNRSAINVIGYTNTSLRLPQERSTERAGKLKRNNLTKLSEAENYTEMLDMLK